MRLINASELEKRSDEEMFEINKYTLRLAPTVDAIPVEWIYRYIKATFEKNGIDLETVTLCAMLQDWRKEND